MSHQKINAGDDVKHSDIFIVDPDQVIVDPACRGRHTPPGEADVVKLANSILERGQLQPVGVRRVEDRRIKLMFGYTRHAAVMYIKHVLKKDIKLKCMVSDANEEEAFKNNIIENRERNVTTSLDDAFNQRRWRQEFGWNDTQIAEFYKCTPAWVAQLTKLLQLPTLVQAKIADGSLPTSAALEVVDLPPAEQAAVLKAATNEQGKVKGSAVKQQVREKRAEKGKATGRSLKELRDFYESLTGPGEDEHIRDFAKVTLGFISGRKSPTQMENAIQRLREA